MIDIEKQIKHWRNSSFEELDAARALLAKKHVRQCLFWGHLAVEKILKAHICKKTNDLAPRTHNLIRLAEFAGLTLSEEQLTFLGTVTGYNIDGRYGELLAPAIDCRSAEETLSRIEEMVAWLNGLL